MADFSAYQLAVGSVNYPTVYNSFVVTVEGYATRIETLEAGFSAHYNGNGFRLTNLSDPAAAQDAATKAYVDAVAWTYNAGNLPSQTGNSGKFLRTNGTVASWQAAGVVGANQPSSNTTLTDATNAVQVSAASADGVGITLPAATGLTLGMPFVVSNPSATSNFGIYYNTGELLHVLSPGQAAVLMLVANGTAAGTWRIGMLDAAVQERSDVMIGPATTFSAAQGSSAGATIEVCRLSATSFVVAYRKPSVAGVYYRIATVANRVVTLGTEYSAGTFTPALVRVVKTNTNTFTVFSCSGSSLYAVPCTFTGTTITSGTVASLITTLASASTQEPGFDVCAPVADGGNGVAVGMTSTGVIAVRFTQAVGATTLTTGTSAAHAATNGETVVAVQIGATTATIAAVFYTDGYSGGNSNLKVAKLSALNGTPTWAAVGALNSGLNNGTAPGANVRGIAGTFILGNRATGDTTVFAYISGAGAMSIRALNISTATLGAAFSIAVDTAMLVQSIHVDSGTRVFAAGSGATANRLSIANLALSSTTFTLSSFITLPTVGTSVLRPYEGSWQAVDTNRYMLQCEATGLNVASVKDIVWLAFDIITTAAPVLMNRDGLTYGGFLENSSASMCLPSPISGLVQGANGYQGIAAYNDTSASTGYLVAFDVTKKVS